MAPIHHFLPGFMCIYTYPGISCERVGEPEKTTIAIRFYARDYHKICCKKIECKMKLLWPLLEL